MTNPIQYYSTNRTVPLTTLPEALLQGQAGDKGLFLPEEYPVIPTDEVASWSNLSYPEVAFNVLRRFTSGVFEDSELQAMCEDAYGYEVPLEPVTGRRHIMRLDRGPTASFKDFAARMMARWMGRLMESEEGELVILTATSGDTGSAVAHAYHGLDRVHVVVLFPIQEVSPRQRMQMTTLGGNVTTIGMEGQFDDCQALVKRAFSDPALSTVRLTSANSINIGRLLPQTVYYFYAYSKLADAAGGEPVLFSIPSGNFGDMMGAVIATRLGLPSERLVIATNANDEVPIFLETGSYSKISPSRVCISNAMNVGHPSNLARLVDLYGGRMDETGELREQPDMDLMRKHLYAVSISDEVTRATIRSAYEKYGVLLEPHGAVGWAGLERYLEQNQVPEDRLAISLETAHPAKFPEEVEALTGVNPELPPSLVGLEDRLEEYPVMKTDYEPLRDLLLERYSKG
jgi:threonine synthase